MMNVGRFFWWMAAASDDVLEKCPPQEQMKYAAVGATLFIPAVTGFLAGFYTLYSLTHSKLLSLVIAIAWALGLVIIDRATLITYRRGVSRLPRVAVRVAIAVVAGILVAHMIVLFVFNDQIAEQISRHRQDSIAALTGNMQPEIDSARHQQEAQFAGAIADQQAIVASLEQDKARLLGDAAIRRRDNMLRAKDAQILAASHDLENIRRQINYQPVEEVQARLKENIDREQHREHADLLSRTEALHEVIWQRIGKGDYTPLVSYLMLMLLFLLLDTVPVLTKLMMASDTFDLILERNLQDAARRALLHAEENWQRFQFTTEQRLRSLTVESSSSSPPALA